MNVSIIMAAKNYARFIGMAIRSVQAQTMSDWELIIIDDGSTDDTPQVVKPFLMDERIQYHRADRLGQSRAKNLGVRFSRGATIAFLDADDAWQPQKLELQIPHLIGSVGVVTCSRTMIDEACQSVGEFDNREGFASHAITRDDIFISNPICFSSVLVKRDVFERVGGFNENLDLSIDYDLWLRVSQHYEIVSLDAKLVLYRSGHGNLSKKQADRIATAFTIMHRHAASVSPRARHQGYGTSHQSLAWLYRGGEAGKAFKAYWRSLMWPGFRVSALKGLLGTLADPFRGRSATATPENHSINC